MGTSEYLTIGLFFLGGIFTLLWFLLRQKDDKQQKEITEIKDFHKKEIDEVKKTHRDESDKLWAQVHGIEKEFLKLLKEDSAALHELRIKIAERHYEKGELDQKFDKIEKSLESGFNKVNDSLDRLNAILLGRAKIVTMDDKTS